MPIKVFNTLTKKMEDFHPVSEREPGREREVGMYVCGVTPYDYSHLGHARTYAAFDIIKRYLEYRGFKVRYVQNITDIDDKIIKRANEKGADPFKLSLEFQKSALEDMDALKVARADKYPKVTEHIPEIIALAKKLVERGYAYETEDGVYFEVEKFPGYGKLSKQSPDEIKAGARIEIDEKKRNPADFALWKKAKPGEPSFESPWGKGRPGWHIECSAMSMKYLGDTFDIHGGGRDLIFPHHENEIAQSEAATGKQFVKYWLHTGFLSVNKEKMAKSLGNFITIKDALNKHDADSLRLFYALTQYRSPIDFSDKNVEQAKNTLEGLRNTITNARNSLKTADDNDHKKTIDSKKHPENFESAMDNDFDTPNALKAVFALAQDINKYVSTPGANKKTLTEAILALEKLLGVFGISLEEAKVSEEIVRNVGEFARELGIKESGNFDETMNALIRKREDARKKGDFAQGDKIRSKLNEIGVILEDNPKGTVWKIKG